MKSCFLTMATTGCLMLFQEKEYGIRRTAILSQVPQFDCIRRVLSGFDEVKVTAERRHDRPATPTEPSRLDVHSFDYEGANVAATLNVRMTQARRCPVHS